MKRIRILFVVNGFSIGGGELKLLELVRELTKTYPERFECSVCSVGSDGPLRTQFEALDIQTEVFLKSGSYDITQILKVAKLIRDGKMDLIQTTLFYADVIGTYAARLAGIRHIISWEAVTQPYSIKHLIAYRLAAKWFAMSVAVSQAIQRQVIEHRRVSARKTCTIRYGVDLKRFSIKRDNGLRLQMGLNPDDILIGTVARLTEQKGHQYLIQAIPDILKRWPNVHFAFLGDGLLHNILKKQTVSLGVDQAVHFLGFRNDVETALRNFDLFVLPSLYEGLPNVVLEAMASQLAVVATHVDGTPEAVVHHKTGLLVPPYQSDPLAKAIISLLDNRKTLENMGKAGRKRVETAFSLENQVQQFIQLYESLLSRGG